MRVARTYIVYIDEFTHSLGVNVNVTDVTDVGGRLGLCP